MDQSSVSSSCCFSDVEGNVLGDCFGVFWSKCLKLEESGTLDRQAVIEKESAVNGEKEVPLGGYAKEED